MAASILCSCISYPSSSEEEQLFELPTISANEKIVRYHDNYVLSYNEETKVANWVAYELTADELVGTADRKTMRFVVDTNVDAKQAKDEDYRGSEWRKGHLAPAADFKIDDAMMLDTFYYTNCAPQNDKFNNSRWNELENRVRGWAKQYGSIYVVTGPVIGNNCNGTLGLSHIVIPDAYFKALCLNLNGQYHTIGFIMENRGDCPKYYECAITVNELEALTGLDFFPTLSEESEDHFDSKIWNITSNNK